MVACFSAYDPEIDCDPSGFLLDLFLLGDDHAAVKERARPLGIMHPGLKWDRHKEVVTDEDVQAVLSSDSGAVWRRDTDSDGEYRDIRDWPEGVDE
jgi:hypothetical protein